MYGTAGVCTTGRAAVGTLLEARIYWFRLFTLPMLTGLLKTVLELFAPELKFPIAAFEVAAATGPCMGLPVLFIVLSLPTTFVAPVIVPGGKAIV